MKPLDILSYLFLDCCGKRRYMVRYLTDILDLTHDPGPHRGFVFYGVTIIFLRFFCRDDSQHMKLFCIAAKPMNAIIWMSSPFHKESVWFFLLGPAYTGVFFFLMTFPGKKSILPLGLLLQEKQPKAKISDIPIQSPSPLITPDG